MIIDYVSQIIDLLIHRQPAKHHIQLVWSLQDRNASICLSPHSPTVGSDSRIPANEVALGDAVFRGDGSTSFILYNKVEGFAVGHHARLNRRRGLHTVSWLHWCWCMADNGHTGVGISPKSSARRSCAGVPCGELRQADTILACYRCTSFIARHKVERIAIVDDGGLCRQGRRDAVRWLRRRWHGRRYRRGVAKNRDTDVNFRP